MYFTQEDYIKIENWLQANSVKDTEFPEASSLSLNEQLTIIQRGENKRIKLEDLVNFLFSQSDSELDTSSTKPIQNQAVARAIYELQNRKFIEIVEELPPTSNAKDNVVYILLNKVGEDNNLFTEWIKVNNTWEKVGEFKAEIDLSPYLKIQDSPFEKGDAENNVVLKGGNNKATNANEVALGKYNISNSDTQFSIGIGTSDTDRKNAVEVKVNGDIYIEGVEGKIQDKLNVTNILDEQLTELSNKVDNLPQGDDFDKQGNYPLLHVGTADDLAGRGESVPASFGFRASGGKSIKDGRAYIKRIKGNSVVWNQVFEPNASDRSYEANGVHIVDNKDGSYTIWTDEGGATQQVNRTLSNTHNLSYAGHKLLITGCDGAVDGFGFWDSFSNTIGTNFKNNVIVSAAKNGSVAFSVVITAGKVVPQTTWKPKVHDLTQMFGVGNEPTTIEEFNARVATLGVDLYAYNEGQVLHCNTESIKSVGDNAYNKDRAIQATVNDNTGELIVGDYATMVDLMACLPNTQYYFANVISYYYRACVHYYDADMKYIGLDGIGGSTTDYLISGTLTTPANARFMRVGTYVNATEPCMVTLVHSGWKQDTDAGYQPYWQDTLPLPIISKYFPDGMKKAGSAHDEIRFNKASGKWEYSKGKIKSVDMGTLNWSLFEGSETFIYTQNTAEFYDGQQLLCAKTFDRIIVHSNGILRVYTNAYTDAASFKAAMAGVILYYETEDWEWVELDEADQNFRDYYNVADFGTEQAISTTPSAAFSADIIYQFNAVDMIREHEIEINELQKVIETMQAQLASLTSNS